MSNSNGLSGLSFAGPATYQILVLGELAANWSDRLAGMSLSIQKGEKGQLQTSLKGRIRDQAELNGVLEALYGLHMSIIKVEQVEDSSESD